MIKHTPGPWVCGYGKTHEIGDVLGVGLNLLPDWKPVCVISQAAGANAEDEANAKLISAAPELLEIAESILADDMLQYLPAEYVAKVRAAIAKATGERIMTILKTIGLLIQQRCLEATAQGQQDVLALPIHPDTRDRITLAYLNTLAAIDSVKAQRRRLQRGNGIRSLGVAA